MHPFLTATREAAASWICTPDGRLSPQTAPGIAEVRVSREQLDRTLAVLDAVVAECGAQGLEVAPVGRTRWHRAGIGIGRGGELTAIRVEERRDLVAFSEEALERWRPAAEEWIRSREFEMRERGWCQRANGRLRLRLPRRHDPSPTDGWRHSFSDQPKRPLEVQIGDIVAALLARAGAVNSGGRSGALAGCLLEVRRGVVAAVHRRFCPVEVAARRAARARAPLEL